MYYAVKKYFHHFKTGQTVDISTFIEGGGMKKWKELITVSIQLQMMN